jgi:RNA-directed DNA polymerase
MLLAKMADDLGVPEWKISSIAQRASQQYKSYSIPKRDGSPRQIHHPSKQLKSLQRWLLNNVIAAWPVHDSARAYRLGSSISENARAHLVSRYLLRMDFKTFFPSITQNDVLAYFDASNQRNFGTWETEDKHLFAKIVCRNGCLTIGAPTSPALSNALCFDLDRKLAGVAAGNQVVYTRYADDLFFSTLHPNVLAPLVTEVEKIVRDLTLPARLQINLSKTRHSSKKGKRQVTGLVLSSEGTVGLGRKRKRYIRSLIFKYETLSEAQQRSLAGLVAFARSIEPDFINGLVLKFGSARINQVRQAR